MDGSAVAPLGVNGVLRGTGLGDKSQRAANAWAGVKVGVERNPVIRDKSGEILS